MNVVTAERVVDLFEIADIGAQDRDVAPWCCGKDDEFVEGVIFNVAVPDLGEGFFEIIFDCGDVDAAIALGDFEEEVVNPNALILIACGDFEGQFGDSA